MADPSAFFRWVIPYASTCPEPVAETHLIDAARDFCKATRCWRHLMPIELDGTETDIAVIPPEATLHEIEEANLDGRDLSPIAFADAEFGEEMGAVEAITQSGPGTVRLAPHAVAGVLTVSCFVMPEVNALSLPDFLLERHGRDIACGALSTILTLPGQPFTDLGMAAVNLKRFNEAKDAAFNISRRGQQRARSRTRARYF